MNDAGVFQQIASVRDGEALLGVLLHHQHADAEGFNGGQVLKQFLAEQWREAKRRFVQRKNLRRGHHRPADGDHLLFAARHGARHLTPPLRQFGKEREDPVEIRRFLPLRPVGESAQLQVFLNRQVAEYAAPLRHKRDAFFNDPVRAKPVQRLTVKRDSARDPPLANPGYRFQQRRLARAVRAEDHHDLARRHGQRGAVQRLMLAIGDAQIPHLKHRRLPDRRVSRRGRTERPPARPQRSWRPRT